jgi:hypothetical protein
MILKSSSVAITFYLQTNTSSVENPGITERERFNCSHNGPIILNRIEFQNSNDKQEIKTNEIVRAN